MVYHANPLENPIKYNLQIRKNLVLEFSSIWYIKLQSSQYFLYWITMSIGFMWKWPNICVMQQNNTSMCTRVRCGLPRKSFEDLSNIIFKLGKIESWIFFNLVDKSAELTILFKFNNHENRFSMEVTQYLCYAPMYYINVHMWALWTLKFCTWMEISRASFAVRIAAKNGDQAGARKT